MPSLSTKPGSQKPAAPEAEKTAAGIAVKAGAAVPPPLPEAKPAAPSPVQLSQASPAGQRPAIPSKEPAAKAAQDTAPPQASAVAPTPKPAATAAEDTRLSVPGDADQEAVEKRIRQIFQQQFSGSRAAGAKVKLAEKLFEQGVATTDDSTARFVLWRLAAETAAEGGELAKSLQIADKLDEGYRFDGLGMKADLVGTVVKSSRSGPLDADATRQSVETVVSLADVAAARDQFEIAGRLIKSAAVAGRRLKDLRLNHDLAAHGHELERLKGKFASVQKALDTLAADPSDGAANAAAGQWYCFVKENWEQGLPLLAKGNGAELAVLAKRDLAQGADAKRQVELADAWWAWAAKEPPPARSVVQARAAHWYEAALPKLSGLDKAAVEQKLKAMAPEAAASNGRGKEPKYAAGPRPEIDIAFEKQGVVDRAGHTHPTVAGALRYTAGPGGQSPRTSPGRSSIWANTTWAAARSRWRSACVRSAAPAGSSSLSAGMTGARTRALFGREGEQLHLHYASLAARVRNTYPVTIETRALASSCPREGTGGSVGLSGRPAGGRRGARGRGLSHADVLPRHWQRRPPWGGLYGRRIVRPPLSQRFNGAADPSPGRQQSGPEEMTTKILFLIPARGGSKGIPAETCSRWAESLWWADRAAWREKPRPWWENRAGSFARPMMRRLPTPRGPGERKCPGCGPRNWPRTPPSRSTSSTMPWMPSARTSTWWS